MARTLCDAPLTGSRLGTYEVRELIGAGAMGDVYRARDSRLGREVAIKVLPEVFTGSPERLARFEREARLLAALNHPHIAAIYSGPSRWAGHTSCRCRRGRRCPAFPPVGSDPKRNLRRRRVSGSCQSPT
jgi:hypothetical protein